MKPEVWKQLNQPVLVRAFGVNYSGIFKGADEDWVYLQCETGWVQIPWLEISSFRAASPDKALTNKERLPGGPEPSADETMGKRDRHLKLVGDDQEIRGDDETPQSGPSEPEKPSD